MCPASSPLTCFSTLSRWSYLVIVDPWKHIVISCGTLSFAYHSVYTNTRAFQKEHFVQLFWQMKFSEAQSLRLSFPMARWGKCFVAQLTMTRRLTSESTVYPEWMIYSLPNGWKARVTEELLAAFANLEVLCGERQ